MEISKKYKDEFGNIVSLDMEDDDVHITVQYNEKSVGRCKDDSFFFTRKDFEKIKELYKEFDANCEGDVQ
ncbi:unnamed protein product [marine sediment metagenome]|uniref:Uncharacterized protein n=1 Tax=marine sediment metagenome TaxID=412755 RepID=X0XCY7_9ZZZZ